jgi:hypothetical protein
MRFILISALTLLVAFTNCTKTSEQDSTTVTDCLAKQITGLYIATESTVKTPGSLVSVTATITSVQAEATGCNTVKFTIRDSETFEVPTAESGVGKIGGGDGTNEFLYTINTQKIEVKYTAANGDVFNIKGTKEQ